MTKFNPKQYAAGVLIPTKRGDARKNTGQVGRRNEAMLLAHEAGASDLEIAQACRAANWHMKTVSVSPRIADARVARKNSKVAKQVEGLEKAAAEIRAKKPGLVVPNKWDLEDMRKEIAAVDAEIEDIKQKSRELADKRLSLSTRLAVAELQNILFDDKIVKFEGTK